MTDASEENFARVGSDWDVEERAQATLDRLGLEQVPLDRRIGELSGGEGVLLCLAAEFLRRPGVLLLDEPTNNLDLDARKRLYDAVASWTGVMVIVSHDRDLLGLVDQIADLSGGQIRMYGGNLEAYEALLGAEQAAAERAVIAASAEVQVGQAQAVQPGAGALLDIPVVPDGQVEVLPGLTRLDRVQRGPGGGDAEQAGHSAAGTQGDGLRQVAHLAAGADHASAGAQLPGDQPEQRRLARAVDPDQAGAAWPDGDGQAGQDGGTVGPAETEI